MQLFAEDACLVGWLGEASPERKPGTERNLLDLHEWKPSTRKEEVKDRRTDTESNRSFSNFLVSSKQVGGGDLQVKKALGLTILEGRTCGLKRPGVKEFFSSAFGRAVQSLKGLTEACTSEKSVDKIPRHPYAPASLCGHWNLSPKPGQTLPKPGEGNQENPLCRRK